MVLGSVTSIDFLVVDEFQNKMALVVRRCTKMDRCLAPQQFAESLGGFGQGIFFLTRKIHWFDSKIKDLDEFRRSFLKTSPSVTQQKSLLSKVPARRLVVDAALLASAIHACRRHWRQVRVLGVNEGITWCDVSCPTNEHL